MKQYVLWAFMRTEKTTIPETEAAGVNVCYITKKKS